jgi:calcineurin-like phosphoesterase family protein
MGSGTGGSNVNEKRYIADLHFFGEDVRQYLDKRPFASSKEMNDYMIRQWNNTVRKGDEIIVLGDMFSKRDCSIYEINRILHVLKGRIGLIIGNHDPEWIKKPGADIERFSWIAEQKTIKDKGRDVLLNHYPILFFSRNHEKDKDGNLSAYMLHGHVHDSQEAKALYRFQKEAAEMSFVTAGGNRERMICNCINCFCGFSDYRPLTLDEWKRITCANGLSQKDADPYM